MKKIHIRHRVERTKNKHSRAIYRDDTVIIRLARDLSEHEEQEHIADLLERMQSFITEENQKILINPFRELLTGNESCAVRVATGKTYTFALSPEKKTNVQRLQNNHFSVAIAPQTRRSHLHRLLWKTISEAELPRITGVVARLNQDTFRARIRPPVLKYAQSQWGSCSPRGVIMLNSALLFVPPSLLKYVIVHELAHTVRRDHSPRYWKQVEWAMPTYRRAREELGNYRLPTL